MICIFYNLRLLKVLGLGLFFFFFKFNLAWFCNLCFTSFYDFRDSTICMFLHFVSSMIGSKFTSNRNRYQNSKHITEEDLGRGRKIWRSEWATSHIWWPWGRISASWRMIWAEERIGWLPACHSPQAGMLNWHFFSRQRQRHRHSENFFSDNESTPTFTLPTTTSTWHRHF